MDTITPVTRREVLRTRIETAQATLRKAAGAAVLQADPLAQQLEAVCVSIGALADIYEASEDTHYDIADSLQNLSDAVTRDAIAKVHVSGMAIIEDLAPRLVEIVEKTERRKLVEKQALRLRVVFAGVAAIALVVLGGAGFAYSVGYGSGRTAGLETARTISAAMAGGQPAASAWARLMTYNDPVQALSICEKAISMDNHGRHYCAMPVWLDPAPAPQS